MHAQQLSSGPIMAFGYSMWSQNAVRGSTTPPKYDAVRLELINSTLNKVQVVQNKEMEDTQYSCSQGPLTSSYLHGLRERHLI